MKTSILICATCLVVTGCSAQLRFPSLSSALSSLTGFGGGSSGGGSGSSGQASGQSSAQSSPYSGLVRDYGRNLMMAMSSIYPTLFKPPQQQQVQPQQSQPNSPSVYDQAFSPSQYAPQNLFPSQSAPSFSFGGSTFSISPSLPFGSLAGTNGAGGSQGQASNGGGSHSPFSASFGSSINSPSSFGPLSSAPFLQQSMPSFAPASSYNAAFEAANGGPVVNGGPPPSAFGNSLSSNPSGLHSSSGSSGLSNQALISQPSNSNPINSYAPLPSYSSQHDSVGAQLGVGSQQHQVIGQQQQAQLNQQSAASLAGHSSAPFGSQQHSQGGNQFASQQYRPDMMSIAASAPVPSSNSYSNYGNIPSGVSSHQAPASPSSYQQPSYR